MGDEAAEVVTFVGDGNYVGDGGELLQRLEFATWKMIRNCPGRYIIKHKKKNPFLIDGLPVTSIDTGDFVRRALATTEGEVPTIVVHDLESHVASTVPRLWCLERKVVVEASSPTANKNKTESYLRLRRKLGGLQIDYVLKL
ncbi:hypothetical protein GQ600_25270 [Phytophthora cactorum]|nr:hypothetical protein GQ600_25270 [Phytophthora cactorum]